MPKTTSSPTTKRKKTKPASPKRATKARGKKRAPARGYYFLLFIAVVAGLWAVKKYAPQYATWAYWFGTEEHHAPTDEATILILAHNHRVDSLLKLPRTAVTPPLDSLGHPIKAPIVDLPYLAVFADKNPLQQPTAMALGVPLAETRADLEDMGNKLEDISPSKLFKVSHLTHSVPLVTPHTARVLERIALNFSDSLRMKGLPPHRFVISSVTRTQEDVNRLKQGNGNASDNSCHFHGTTVDIAYNKYESMPDSTCPGYAPTVATGKLKAVLGEVLRDMREAGFLYVLYEVHQPCFHITVR